jgi:hypothetical protein
MLKSKSVFFGGLAAIAVPATALAQTTNGPLTAINACRAVPDPSARLACFDKEVEALNAATTRKDVVIVDKTQMKESRKGLFGFNIGRIPIFGGGKDETDTPEDKELTATVKTGRALPDGRWRFTLESGAVWETIEPLRSAREPKAGAEVQLAKAALGSYFLTLGNGRATRAKRVN